MATMMNLVNSLSNLMEAETHKASNIAAARLEKHMIQQTRSSSDE